ncbi:MAG TPA: hypothetical protein VLK32_02960 [Bacillota bacterium]|nr:hypothetical protein [Bacillota bacterium]
MGTKSVGRGMVLEVRGRSALVLADGGEFRWVPLKGEPGDLGGEVRFIRRQSLALRPLLRPALVMASVIALMVLLPRAGALGPIAARVSLDINPSFELAVDARERVVEAVGVDGSGMELVRAAGSVRGLDLGVVLERLLHVARERRYLDPAGPNVLVLAVTPLLPGQERLVGRIQALGEQAKAAADRELTGAAAITLASLQVSPAVWQEARAVGLTAGRYAVLLRAQERGLALEVEDVREGRLGEAIGRAGGLAAEVVAGDDPPEVLEDLAEKFRERNRARRPERERGQDEREDEDDERPEEERRNEGEDQGDDEDELSERPDRPGRPGRGDGNGNGEGEDGDEGEGNEGSQQDGEGGEGRGQDRTRTENRRDDRGRIDQPTPPVRPEPGREGRGDEGRGGDGRDEGEENESN